MYWFEVQVYPTYSRAVFVPPFRVLGLITSQIPFYVQTHSRKGATDGPRVDILICLGKSCALWEGMKMTLLFVGPGVEDSMSCVAMDGDAIWCASGLRAIKYLTGKEVCTSVELPLTFLIRHQGLEGNKSSGFRFILPFFLLGPHLTLTEDGTRMLIWGCFRSAILATGYTSLVTACRAVTFYYHSF
ncbi:hypothetical protein F5141DRAFT_1115229 [Pisolithus sp. B1]|nr:hypothetical protein F5141DRAFT_1115229 [Pisolithus sp. B1]